MRGEARKIIVKRLMKNEKGQALVLVLILLLIGGLISAPLLSYVGTGLNTGQIYERRTDELYSADAGVEDAVWKIQNSDGYLPCSPGSPPRSYTITDVNGKSIAVNITSELSYEGLTYTYRVLSTAIGDDTSTQIEAYIVGINPYGDYEGLLGSVLTSQADIDFPPHWEDYVDPSEGENGPVENYTDPWPTASELASFYYEDVAGVEPYDDNVLDLYGVDMEIGPFYRDGPLTIDNTGGNNATLTLTGTVYVTGLTTVEPNSDLVIDLNGQTLFIESDSTKPPKEALYIKAPKITLIGSGIIIAVGDIYFEPNTPAGVTDPVFVMSVDGLTNVQPGGDFYGSIAGSIEIDLQPGTSINYPTDPDWYEDLNFLLGVKMLIFHIFSWEVIPLSPGES
jgi:hypothetical protein